MIKSMTGFAATSREDPPFAVAVTVKSVNHRYLDLQVRLPSSLAAIEPALRSLVPKRLARGRVEVTVALQSALSPTMSVTLNEGFVSALRRAIDAARREGLVHGELTPGDLLRLPQALVVRELTDVADGVDPRLVRLVETACDEALEALDEMRNREGGFLREDLERRRAGLAAAMVEVEGAATDAQQHLGERLRRRILEVAGDLAEPSAVAQEVVRFVSRSDIHEEIVRFHAHLAHWSALVASAEPSGRKLDFLLQEMNREINTIGSKAEGQRVPALVVELKAELERMREQVQNIE